MSEYRVAARVSRVVLIIRSLLGRVRHTRYGPDRREDTIQRFLASWEELQTSISRIRSILPTIEDQQTRRRILKELANATATFEQANAALMDCIPSSTIFMSSSSGVQEDEAEEILRAVDRASVVIDRLELQMEEEVRHIDQVISSSSRSSSAQSYQSSHYSSVYEDPEPQFTLRRSSFTIHPIHMPFNPDYSPSLEIPDTSDLPPLTPPQFYPSTPRTPADYPSSIDIKPMGDDFRIPPLPPVSKHSTPSPTTFYPYGAPPPPPQYPQADRYTSHPTPSYPPYSYDSVPPPMSRGPSSSNYHTPSIYDHPPQHQQDKYPNWAPAPPSTYRKKSTSSSRPPPIPIPRASPQQTEYDYPSFDYDSSYPEHFREFVNPAPPPLPPVGYGSYGGYGGYGSYQGGYEDRPFTRYL